MLYTAAACLSLILLALWGEVSLRRSYGRVAGVLRQAAGWLERLQLDAIQSPEDDQTVQGVFDQVAVESVHVARAWQVFSDSVITVAGCPRTTAELSRMFDPRRLVMRESEGLRALLSPRVLENLSARLVRLGWLLGLLVLTMVWSASSGPVGADALGEVLPRALPGLGYAAATAATGALLSTIFRYRRSLALDDLDWALTGVTGWIETRYRRVSAEELLARLLAQDASHST